jgi:hypothetical protein
MIVLVNQKAYRGAEKWSGYAILIGGCISWSTFIIYKIYIGYIGATMITFVVGINFLVLEPVFSVKDILCKKSI